jgi:hypothetical protein
MLIETLGFFSDKSLIKKIIASFLIGYFVMAIIGACFISIQSDKLNLFFILFFTSLTIVHLAFFTIKKIKEKNNADKIEIEISILEVFFFISLLIVFFLYYLLHFNIALIPFTDESRHFAYSMELGKKNFENIIFPYALYHYFLNLCISLTHSYDIQVLHSGLFIISLLVPIMYYEFVKDIYKNFDKRLPMITTFLFIFYSNFWFLPILMKQLDSPLKVIYSFSPMEVLLYNSRYNWLSYFVCFSFSPIAIGILSILLCMSLVLRKKETIKFRDLFIFSLFSFIALASHLVEGILLGLLLSLMVLLLKDNKSGFILAYSCSLFLWFIIILFKSHIYSFRIQIMMSVIPLIFVCLFSILLRKLLEMKKQNILFLHKVYSLLNFRILTKYLLIIYVLFIFFDFIIGSNFNFWGISHLSIVPWYMYPSLLGLIGMLAIFSLPNRKAIPYSTFLIAATIAFILLGRLISFLNINIFYTGIGEGRFIGYEILLLSPLAAYSLLCLLNKKKKIIHSKILYTFLIISLTIFYSMGGTLLSPLYWNSMNYVYGIKESDLHLIQFIKSLNGDFLAPNTRTCGLLYMAGIEPKLSGFSNDFLFLDKSASSLIMLHNEQINRTPLYLMLSKSDKDIFNKSFIISNLSNFSNEIYSNQEYSIYKLNLSNLNSFNISIFEFNTFQGWMESFEVSGSLITSCYSINLENIRNMELYTYSSNKTIMKFLEGWNNIELKSMKEFHIEIKGNIIMKILKKSNEYTLLQVEFYNPSKLEAWIDDGNIELYASIKVYKETNTMRMLGNHLIIDLNKKSIGCLMVSVPFNFLLNGEIKLHELYDRTLLFQEGQDLIINGQMNIKANEIGGYIFIEDKQINGISRREPPLVEEPNFLILNWNSFINVLLLLPLIVILLECKEFFNKKNR